MRQWSCLDFSIAKNHRICKPLDEVQLEKWWTSNITWRVHLSGKHGDFKKVKWFKYMSSRAVPFIGAFISYLFFQNWFGIFYIPWVQVSQAWCVGLGSLSGAVLCFSWLSNMKPVYTLMLVSTYSSLDGGNLPPNLQPGAFQLVREVERRRGKNSRR